MSRNYRKEYDNYQSRPKQRKNRAKRNSARSIMIKKNGMSVAVPLDKLIEVALSYSFVTNSVASVDADSTNTGLPEVESTPTHLPVTAYSDKTPVRCEVRNVELLLDSVRELPDVFKGIVSFILSDS